MDIQRGTKIVIRSDLRVSDFIEVRTTFGTHRTQWTKRMQQEIAGKTLTVKYIWYQDGTIRTCDGWRVNTGMIDMQQTELLNTSQQENDDK